MEPCRLLAEQREGGAGQAAPSVPAGWRVPYALVSQLTFTQAGRLRHNLLTRDGGISYLLAGPATCCPHSTAWAGPALPAVECESMAKRKRRTCATPPQVMPPSKDEPTQANTPRSTIPRRLLNDLCRAVETLGTLHRRLSSPNQGSPEWPGWSRA